MDFGKTLPGCIYKFIFVFFAKTFAFAEKYCQSVLGGAIFLLQRQPSFFCFFSNTHKSCDQKKRFCIKTAKRQFLISSRLQKFSAYESFGGDAGIEENRLSTKLRN